MADDGPRGLPHDWFDQPLPPGVEIGPRSWLYSSFAFLHAARPEPLCVSIGHDSGVYDRSFFELGPGASVSIGNYCTIVGAIIRTEGSVAIADHVLVSHDVVIADTPWVAPPGSGSSSGPAPAEPSVVIGRNAWIGTRAILLGGARIGENSIVGAGCVVDFETGPDSVIVGNPARITRGRLVRRPGG